MSKHFERLMEAISIEHEAVLLVVMASTPREQAEANKLLKQAEARKENVINSLPPKMRQEVRQQDAQLNAKQQHPRRGVRRGGDGG